MAASGETLSVFSDPDVTGDGLQCDQARGFLEVEAVVGSVELRVYRYAGANADTLFNLDDGAAFVTATVAGVYRIDWDEPLPAYLQTKVNVVNPGPDAVVIAAFRVIQTARTRQ